MQVTVERFELRKRHALTISRGTITGSVNLGVRVEHEGVVGLGEVAPGDVYETSDAAEADLVGWAAALEGVSPWEQQRVDDLLRERPGRSAAAAGLDLALHDWIGKRADAPLWRLWGLSLERIAPTSLTIGINPPDVVRDKTVEIMTRTGARVFKVKLGSPRGLDHDRASFVATQEAARSVTDEPVAWRVDANGGWEPDDAVAMITWLAARHVAYVEQPLARGREADLPHVFSRTVLPIYADESVRVAADVPALADRVHGVNLKLMKTGGLREAMRVIHTARSHRLGVMIGCMGESSLSITAGAHLSPLVDHVDLDSHLNLLDDPFAGASFVEGRVVPNDRPGLGVESR
jgi:L-Ala-D/L-Glu epimerase